VSELKEAAEAEDHAWRTVERAKDELGIEAARSGFGSSGAWFWALPGPIDRLRQDVAAYEESEAVSPGEVKDRQVLPDQRRSMAGCVRCERYGPDHTGGHVTSWGQP
jgi:hypothetical protein